ncbi:unnamed protein product [Penicillium camemberti]|uniref:Str. FM013 n=1 Tax=Penicillium camemberti (strain FM 013) TaxID=1429867 RepID=A0A0G4PXP4_PENC3|nr:unnamed protein product [Penicillium camemberti]
MLASSPESQTVSAILGEIAYQCEQVHARDKELKKAQDQVLDLKERKRVAIEEMFAANKGEKAKQKDALDRVESLCASVNQKDKRLTEYSKEVQGLRQQIDSIKSSYSLELDKVSQSAKDISTLQQNLKEKDKTINRMKTAGSSLKSMFSSAQKNIEELGAEKASLDQALQASQGPTPKPRKLHYLWVFASSEVFAILREDLDEEVLKVCLYLNPLSDYIHSSFDQKDKSIWDKLRKENTKIAQNNIPLVPLNSLEAKGMRLAMTMAILSRELCKYIFRPNYLLPDDSEIQGVLSHLAEDNTEKESFCRRVLLSIDHSAEERIRQTRIQTVIRNVSSYLWALLSETQHDSIRISIEKIRHETEFELVDFEIADCEPFHFPGDSALLDRQDQGARDMNILTVFPCISLVKDGGRDPLTHLIQLRSSQKLFVAAEHEASQMTTSVVVPRRSSTRSRRKSIAHNTDRPNGASFLEGKSPQP